MYAFGFVRRVLRKYIAGAIQLGHIDVVCTSASFAFGVVIIAGSLLCLGLCSVQDCHLI
jgi:hypothetical protein